MIMNKNTVHIKYYFLMSVMLITGLIVMLSLQGNKEMQIGVLFTLAVGYVALALAHQHVHHRINAAIVLEYALFGVLGIIIALLYFK